MLSTNKSRVLEAEPSITPLCYAADNSFGIVRTNDFDPSLEFKLVVKCTRIGRQQLHRIFRQPERRNKKVSQSHQQ
jgi:hypothetical protein